MSTVIDQRNHRNLCYRLAPSVLNTCGVLRVLGTRVSTAADKKLLFL
jgi:hypothetical protein